MNTAKLKAAADLLLNATEISNQLRHLADNEIDSDSFAVVTENYNGRETEFERPITDLAIDAAVVIDGLIAALEAADKLNAELDERLLRYAGIATRRAEHVAELEKRNAELERSELQLIEERDNAEEALADMYQAATGERPEWSNWFGYADAVDAVTDRVAKLEAGINLETGGEA